MIVSFIAPDGEQDPARLDAELILGDTLPHPDLTPFVNDAPDGLTIVTRDDTRVLRIAGRMDPDHAAAVEEAIWGRMRFATHLRARRLGEFTIGTELHRSESLALVQLLVLYQLVTAKATVSLGGEVARANGTSEAVGAGRG
jgi:phosphoribulokinase